MRWPRGWALDRQHWALQVMGRQIHVALACAQVSLPLFMKFSGPFLLLLIPFFEQMGCWCVLNNWQGLQRTWRAMAAHVTQWVWYVVLG